MKYIVTKLDGRHANKGSFRFMIEFPRSHFASTDVLDFDRSLRWFTDNFGWGQDVAVRNEMLINQRKYPENYQPNDINPVWAYSIKYNNYRIYVSSEAELNWYVLSHPKHV